MLKILKQAWKKSDASAALDVQNGTSHVAHSEAAREKLSDLAATNSREPVATVTTPTNGVVRPRDSDDLSVVNGDGLARPAKRRKMEPATGPVVPLRLLDLEKDAYRIPLEKEELLNRVRMENGSFFKSKSSLYRPLIHAMCLYSDRCCGDYTQYVLVGILTGQCADTAHTLAKHDLIRQLLARRVDEERRRAADDDSERRIVLFIVELVRSQCTTSVQIQRLCLISVTIPQSVGMRQNWRVWMPDSRSQRIHSPCILRVSTNGLECASTILSWSQRM